MLLWPQYGRQTLAAQTLGMSTERLRSPGLCLPLGGGLQLTLSEPPGSQAWTKSYPLTECLWCVTFHNEARSSLAFQMYISGFKSESSESHTQKMWNNHQRGTCRFTLRPVNLRSSLWLPFGLHDAESFLLLAYFLLPLLVQKRYQRVPHVHHFDHLLKDSLFFCLLLWCLIWKTKTYAHTQF